MNSFNVRFLNCFITSVSQMSPKNFWLKSSISFLRCFYSAISKALLSYYPPADKNCLIWQSGNYFSSSTVIPSSCISTRLWAGMPVASPISFMICFRFWKNFAFSSTVMPSSYLSKGFIVRSLRAIIFMIFFCMPRVEPNESDALEIFPAFIFES